MMTRKNVAAKELNCNIDNNNVLKNEKECLKIIKI